MTTIVYPRQNPRPRAAISSTALDAPEAAREVARTLRRPIADLGLPAWPRPRLVHDHAALFREPTYADGQPYATDDDEDDQPAAP
ncbi:hypothetical protein [Streptomyces sp. NBRC 110035]|uniref:hypothetical protein n=1 Tax=Streptomyces sp. NBRC 110035 TaxID=1547867 RepID=UPI0005A76847|nr:hypothetical protein [Streptomyces sp. NBRC 110035]